MPSRGLLQRLALPNNSEILALRQIPCKVSSRGVVRSSLRAIPSANISTCWTNHRWHPPNKSVTSWNVSALRTRWSWSCWRRRRLATPAPPSQRNGNRQVSHGLIQKDFDSWRARRWSGKVQAVVQLSRLERDKNMPIDRYGSGNPYRENREDYSRASSLTSSQQQDIATYHHLGYNADDIAVHLRVDPRAVQDHLRQQGVAMDQPEASSSRGQTRRDETPFFDPGSPYVDPGAPSPYRQSEPPTPGFNADAWSEYGDPGAPTRYQSSEPPTPRDTHPQTPLFLSSLQSPTPGPSTPRPSSSRQPSLPPAPGGYSSSTPRPATARRASTRPSQPPPSSSSSLRMPPPPIFHPQPRFDPYPPGSSRFGGGSLSGAIPTPDLNAMTQQMAAPPGSLQEGFTTENLPTGWAANVAENELRSPGGSSYPIETRNRSRLKPERKRATQEAFSRLLHEITRTPGLSRGQVSQEALGKNRYFLSGINKRLSSDLQGDKMSREEYTRLAQANRTPEWRSEIGKKGGLASQANRTPEQRREISRKGGLASQANRTPEQRKEFSRLAQANVTPEHRKKGGLASQAKRSPEERKEFSRQGNTMKTNLLRRDWPAKVGRTSQAGPSQPGSTAGSSRTGRAAAVSYPAENAPNISEIVLQRYHQQHMSIADIARQLEVRETFVSNIIWDTVDEEQPPSD